MSTKTKTFRVRRVPAKITLQCLAQFLQDSVIDLGGEENIHIRSLAPSPDDWTSPRSQTATLEFNEIPNQLQDANKATWEFTPIGSDSPVIFDTHFLGFTPLNSVDEHHHTYDLIAVSGLASHPFGSWRQRRLPGQRQFMWLRDQLPHDFPTMRCMTYGYDTKLVESDSYQTLDDLAFSFISHLSTIGRAEHSARPLILLGHSLGGILVKRALSLLAASEDAREVMLSKTKLFMAFGVPNRGMRMDHLLTVIGPRPNRGLVELLAENPPNGPYSLFLLDDTFSGVAQHYSIRVVSAYETEMTPLTEVQSNGDAQRTGNLEVLVHRESAVQGRSKNPQDIFPINRNHSDMVKFERDDLYYSIVCKFVRETICTPDESGENGLILEPESPGPTSFLQRSRHHVRESAQSGDTAPAVSAKINDEVTTTRPNDAVDPQVLLKSLDFVEGNFRLEAIERAHESTFGWIFEKPGLGFIPWILSGTGVYWIRGKPGSGKSTLMKYLHDTEQLKEAIGARHGRQIDLWFFFNERGTYLQKSLDGLLRGMLGNLVSQEPALAELALGVYRRKPRQIRDRWSFEDLKDAFAAVLAQNSDDLELTIFLDALDEYYGFPEVISQWILDTMLTSRDPHNRTKVRFCFSSREWDSFVKAFGGEPGFLLHEHTYQDVEQYAISRLSRLTSQHPFAAEDRSMPNRRPTPVDVARTIAAQAEGVFLWVKLAIDEISSLPTFASQEELDVIARLPADLENFYTRIISRIPKHSRFRAFTLLEIVSRSLKLVSPQDLFYASACALGSTFQECEKHLCNAESQFAAASNKSEEISRDFLNLCGGLLECVKVTRCKPSKIWVQFTHRTVRDFVANPQFPQIILGDAYQLQLDNGYTFLLKYHCVSRGERQNPNLTLLELAYHDERSTGRAATTFINSLPESFFARHSGRDTLHDYYTSPFLFAVLGNLYLYVGGCLGDLSTHRAECPLHKIVRHSLREGDGKGSTMDYSKMAQLLLRQGFSVKYEYLRMTPFETIFCPGGKTKGIARWRFVSYRKEVDLARILIQDGKQDANALLRLQRSKSTKKRRSALHLTGGGMTQMLLENGADVNLRDYKGVTPLDALVLEREFSTSSDYDDIMLLLSHGGRFSRRGKKGLPEFQKKARQKGFHFPDELNTRPVVDEATEGMSVVERISEFISRYFN